jgi:hypothetical protein
MRLWSIKPEYLDAKGLVALWREGLLARKVLAGRTTGYKRHPQLLRFKEMKKPVAAMDAYLDEVYREACRRGYSFNHSKIKPSGRLSRIWVNKGQAEYEMTHLRKKLRKRDLKAYARLKPVKDPAVNRVFKIRDGGVEKWEKQL